MIRYWEKGTQPKSGISINLDEHDKTVRNKVLDDFTTALISDTETYSDKMIKRIAEQFR